MKEKSQKSKLCRII